ncbi:MAG: XRE family transcriptional regulator [Methylocystaceae bacterium]|nr:MAG: XRE family transcriptional regulator [Methylocystaceae bacterium]
MDMRRLVGRNVRRIRLEKRLSQEQFAERSGFTQQYLSDLERGLRNPTIVSLYELAQALGVDHVSLVAPDEEASSDRAAGPAPKPARAKAGARKAGKRPSGAAAPRRHRGQIALFEE